MVRHQFSHSNHSRQNSVGENVESLDVDLHAIIFDCLIEEGYQILAIRIVAFIFKIYVEHNMDKFIDSRIIMRVIQVNFKY
jgi:hypothetical protein